MKSKSLLMTAFVLLALSSCATSYKLSSAGEKVEVLKNRPEKCVVLGKFDGMHEEGSVDLARNQAINQAADEGATEVYIIEEVNNGKKWEVQLIGYRC